MGKRMFEEGERGGPEEPPFHTQVFVLTHEVRAQWERKGGTTFHFVNDGIEAALRRARAAAGEKDVRISGGGATVLQSLNAGLVDELLLSLAPTFLGGGVRLFEGIDKNAVDVSIMEVVRSPKWTTDSVMAEHTGLLVDREYACIFKLQNPRDCSMAATSADPTLQDSCDCQPPDKGGAFTHAQIPAVCNDNTPTQQHSAKAYPTVRELEVAHLLGAVPGANVGIISSLCPIHTTDMSANNTDPLYGYRPAMNAIISALSKTLAHQCLPQRLTIDKASNQVPCLVLGTFPGGNGAPTSCCDAILSGAYLDPDPTVLKEFRTDQHAAFLSDGSIGIDSSTELTCELKQPPPNEPCDTGSASGWCYCADPAWAEWPMPNSSVDVANGAPNAESYTNNGDGTVTDNVTGLMWQRATPAGELTQTQAISSCTSLNLAGHNDWRLPSTIELLSIVDYTQSQPAIDGVIFPSTPPQVFVAATPVASASASFGSSMCSVWVVSFNDGSTDCISATGAGYVRCVR